jgi:hypothetical protein
MNYVDFFISLAGQFAFLVPFRRSSNFYSGYNLKPACNGLVAKINMLTLEVSYIDLTVIKEDLCGFAGGFSGNFQKWKTLTSEFIPALTIPPLSSSFYLSH